jgi:hypothetical protein
MRWLRWTLSRNGGTLTSRWHAFRPGRSAACCGALRPKRFVTDMRETPSPDGDRCPYCDEYSKRHPR